MNPPDRSPHSYRALACFIALALGLTWAVQIPGALASRGLIDLHIPDWLYPAALFGPAVAALLTTAWFEGFGAVKTLLRSVARVRVSVRWYVVALLAPPATLGAALLAWRTTGHTLPVFSPWPQAALSTITLTPLFAREELGWRGFLLPHLLQRTTPLIATAWTALVWAIWHVPTYFALTTVPYALLAFLAILPISALFTLVYLRTRSVLLCMLLHSSVDCSAAHLLFEPFKHDYLPVFALWVVALWLFALGLVFSGQLVSSGAPVEPGTSEK